MRSVSLMYFSPDPDNVPTLSCKICASSRAGSGEPQAEDLESECYIALWKELASGKPAFLSEQSPHIRTLFRPWQPGDGYDEANPQGG